ncbi:3-phosphoshikimate 1-carboxyvinyltransferase [Akkermansiaceae bacterium]|nr:3-phosphoshikimate 1-carboxyvinyltransferase [Akkermansiaceae bacterium]MDA7896042.1 3-phosphoshikimate 1-carboxyvinyltransferase [bacterium]MDA7907532.1 3-phosphoshikimate 1-carboxyvinyltransferase [Akkermansiaceae bacterium]MDA7933953.1 3-phosphoshikimate 1-carboxyvinyltransferase [Akkermansiaceae bacterium]MDA9831072.1 3-phosphoshikimate 1-carboxyvinyltransferase [Akkermansiaceae bacterium]
MSETIQVSPLKSITGELAVPGDKSISHRAAILAGLSNGSCFVENFLSSEDCVNTLRAMAQLGVRYEVQKGSEDLPVDLLIHGCGGELQAPKRELDCGNSGTGMRLLAGVLAAQNFDSTLIGDESLSGRPMGRIITPLAQMGARFETKGAKPGCAPLQITGGELKPITYEMPMASAQVKSAILLAGLFAPGTTTVIQPATNRDHTERLLNSFGVKVKTEGNTISIDGGQVVEARDLVVPGDISSASFWIVAAASAPGSRLTITNVGLNPTRTALLDVLIRMGAQIEVHLEHEDGGEPRGRIEITGGRLQGTEILKEEVPNLIDEVPILAVAGALADGKMTIRNAAELRVKETDRIETTTKNLRLMGGEVEEFEDGMIITGGRTLKGAGLDSYGDHRIAMAFAIAGLLAGEGQTTIANTACVATSYPTFAEHLETFCQS